MYPAGSDKLKIRNEIIPIDAHQATALSHSKGGIGGVETPDTPDVLDDPTRSHPLQGFVFIGLASGRRVRRIGQWFVGARW